MGGSSSSGSSDGSGGVSVGEQLPWPSADMGSSEGGGVDQEFEDSLGDFDEAIAGDSPGSGDEEIDILDPMGESGSGAQSDEPVFEEGDLSEDGASAENQAIAQRAASGGGESSSSSSGGSEGGDNASGQQSGNKSQNQAASGGGGGGGAGAPQGDREVGGVSAGDQQGDAEIVPIPEDIGDGRNDDIVLRQIREAAMNERDPKLREKLWDEYRRIRGAR